MIRNTNFLAFPPPASPPPSPVKTGHTDTPLPPFPPPASVKTGDTAVFNFFPRGAPAKGLEGLVRRYTELAPLVKLSGPTSFAPAIHYVRRR